MNIVCKDYGIEIHELLLKTRKRRIVEPKQVSHFFCKEMTQMTYDSIGFMVGRVNHATVIHSFKTVLGLIETDRPYRERIKRIETRLMIEALKDYQPKPTMSTYPERKAMILNLTN
jgi:chromosomal replication initiator protein